MECPPCPSPSWRGWLKQSSVFGELRYQILQPCGQMAPATWRDHPRSLPVHPAVCQSSPRVRAGASQEILCLSLVAGWSLALWG